MTDSTGLHDYEFDRVLRCMLCARWRRGHGRCRPVVSGEEAAEFDGD